MKRGSKLVVIDNTNLTLWQMQDYIDDGVRNGYDLLFLEFDGSLSILERRNIHGVTLPQLQRMNEKFERRLSEEKIMQDTARKLGIRLASPAPTDSNPVGALADRLSSVELSGGATGSGNSGRQKGRRGARAPANKIRSETDQNLEAMRTAIRHLGGQTNWSQFSEVKKTDAPPLPTASGTEVEELEVCSNDRMADDATINTADLNRRIGETTEEEVESQEEERLVTEVATNSQQNTADFMDLSKQRDERVEEGETPIGSQRNTTRLSNRTKTGNRRVQPTTQTSEGRVVDTSSHGSTASLNNRTRPGEAEEVVLNCLGTEAGGDEEEVMNSPDNSPTCNPQLSITNQLQEMFPQFTLNHLHQVASSSGHHIERAVEMLVEGVAATTGEEGSASAVCSNSTSGVATSNFSSNSSDDGYASPDDDFCLPITYEFIIAAHGRFASEFATQEVDFENIPPELLVDWKPPIELVRAIYEAFLFHLGLDDRCKQTTASTWLPAAGDEVEEMEEDQELLLYPPSSLSPPHVPVNQTGCSSIWSIDPPASLPPREEGALTLREIQDEEEAIRLSVMDQLERCEQDYGDAGVHRWKLARLLDQFPGIGLGYLQQVFVSCGMEEGATRSCLTSQNHRFMPTCNSGSHGRSWASLLYTRKKLELGSAMKTNHRNRVTSPGRGQTRRGVDADVLQHPRSRLQEKIDAERARLAAMRQGEARARDLRQYLGIADYYHEEANNCRERLRWLVAQQSVALISDRRAEMGVWTLDLHHLTLSNALHCLEDRLAELETQTAVSGHPVPRKCRLNVLTGWGRNSPFGRARLKPAVRRFLKDRNYQFVERYDGYFRVVIQPTR